MRHGKDPAEMGGTNIDCRFFEAGGKRMLMGIVPGNSSRFLKYYMEELKDQFRGLKK